MIRVLALSLGILSIYLENANGTAPYRVFMEDFTGDGKADLCYIDRQCAWFVKDGRTGKEGVPGIAWGERIPGWNPDGQIFVADFDADGKADRAFMSGEARWFVKSTGTGVEVKGIPWGHEIKGWRNAGRIFVADFDGDRKADRALFSKTGRWFVQSTGTGVEVKGIPWGSAIPGWDPNGRIYVDDFDGDGKADRCYYAKVLVGSRVESRWYVHSTGTGVAVKGIPWGHRIPGWDPEGMIFIGDFDGDGYADRCYLAPTGRFYLVSTKAGSHLTWGGDHLLGISAKGWETLGSAVVFGALAFTPGFEGVAAAGFLALVLTQIEPIVEAIIKQKERIRKAATEVERAEARRRARQEVGGAFDRREALIEHRERNDERRQPGRLEIELREGGNSHDFELLLTGESPPDIGLQNPNDSSQTRNRNLETISRLRMRLQYLDDRSGVLRRRIVQLENQ